MRSISVVSTLIAMTALAGCGSADSAAPADPAMDAEVRRTIAAGIAVQRAAIEADAFAVLPVTGKRAAPVRFDGKEIVCARLDDPARVAKAGGRDRVMMIDLVQFADGAMQGPWFDYLWRRSGC